MKRRRFTKVGFDTKLIVDVVAASLIVQQAPRFLQSIIPMDDTIGTVAGVGVGYLAGSMFKRPGIANAAIALGAVQFVAPLVDDLLGGGAQLLPTMKPPVESTAAGRIVAKMPVVNDYLTLNDYVTLSASQVNETYRNSY